MRFFSKDGGAFSKPFINGFEVQLAVVHTNEVIDVAELGACTVHPPLGLLEDLVFFAQLRVLFQQLRSLRPVNEA